MADFADEKKRNERLAELRKLEEEQLAEVLAKKYGVQYVDLTQKSISSEALRLVPEGRARAAEIAPFHLIGKKIFVAMRAPERSDSLQEVDQLERLGYTPTRFITSRASLEHAWERYADLSYASSSESGVLALSGETVRKMLGLLSSIEAVGVEANAHAHSKDTHRISHIIEVLLGGALSLGASDIHLEPEEDTVRVRYRLDGVLTPVTILEPEVYQRVASRIKLLSDLKLNIKNEAQDGRFSIALDAKDIEIRTSILPGAYAETIVMRVLDPASIAASMESMGFDQYLMEIFRTEIAKPNGMILNTGPTGSGKTTTLYAFLRAVHNPEIKIITIEDPIEYHLPGIVQTQVEKNYTFAEGLRSTLRQDPDVIMVGEIRDKEVAETAVHAALTGHLVFSTLHTNDAAGTFPRLADMGIHADILSAALTMTMAQRLVRKLCPACREERILTEEEKTLLAPLLANIPHPESLPEKRDAHFIARGCPLCRGTGYKGRVAVVEVIRMDRAIENCVRQSSSERDIWMAARGQNIRRMAQDGVAKVLSGVTSLEELSRVIDLKGDVLLATIV